MRELFRIPPKLPVGAVQTYKLDRPLTEQFWQRVGCGQVDCDRYRKGWTSQLDTSTIEGRKWALWIVNHSGRHFTKVERGPIVIFTFPAGQQCFEKHKRPRERDPLFVVRAGDHRGNPTGWKRQHSRGEDWRDDMAERLDAVAEAQRRG